MVPSARSTSLFSWGVPWSENQVPGHSWGHSDHCPLKLGLAKASLGGARKQEASFPGHVTCYCVVSSSRTGASSSPSNRTHVQLPRCQSLLASASKASAPPTLTLRFYFLEARVLVWAGALHLASDCPLSISVLIPLQVTDRSGVGPPEQAMVPSEPQFLCLPSVSWEVVVLFCVFQNKKISFEI